ncbi:hypothetical protein ABI_16550 [Asticcacaulis biprosthecium C19]|uniref:Uncharacterized protein n=1 Tax=Asticcacaulis biprosthecium C19 TaxID=715226 RepID=F4QJV8_9CAUL|nr:hypothetical protein ABI_16550 [Asticcacaulis biprosthecium C19]
MGGKAIDRYRSGAVVGKNRSIVDQDMQRPQGLDGITDQVGNAGGLAEVTADGCGVDADRFQFGNQVQGIVARAVVVDRDIVALARKGHGDGPADALGGAGDQGALSQRDGNRSGSGPCSGRGSRQARRWRSWW